jgi:hypothetical protein
MARGSTVQEFSPQGVNLDSMPVALAADVYTGVSNMRTSGSGMTRADGETPYDPQVPIAPKWGICFNVGYAPVLLVAGDAGVQISDGAVWTDVKPASGWNAFTAGQMTGGLLNGYPVFNAPGMAPWYYDGTVVKPLPGWLAGKQTFTLAPFNQHLFAGSIISASIDNEYLAWSDAATLGNVPLTWTPTTANQAGDLYLGLGSGPVMAMHPLMENLMVYRTAGCYAVTYSGRPFIYTARKVSAEIGAASCNAVARVGSSHALMTPGDFILTDGTAVRSIGEGRVKRNIFAQISENGLKRCHAYVVQSRNEVVFALALGREDVCNMAYVWDTTRDKWSIRELPDITHTATGIIPQYAPPDTWTNDAGTWDTDDKPWDSPPFGGYKPNPAGMSPTRVEVFNLDVGDTRANGDSITAVCERTAILIGDEPRVKLIHALYPKLEGMDGDIVTIRVGGQMAPSDLVTWGPAQDYVIGRSRRIDCNVQGRYAAIHIEGRNLAPWSISGFGIEFSQRGYA